MITTAVAVSTDGTLLLGASPTYGILLAILLVHGMICSAGTRVLARLNLVYGFLTGMSVLLAPADRYAERSCSSGSHYRGDRCTSCVLWRSEGVDGDGLHVAGEQHRME